METSTLSSKDLGHDDSEAWNLARFDPSAVSPSRGHVESTFIKINDPTAPRALWVKMTIFAPTEKTSGGPPFERGRTVAEAWAIAFDRSADDGPAPSYREGSGAMRGGGPPRHVAAKKTVPIEDAFITRTRPFRLAVAGVEFDGRRLVGEITHGHARIRFDLTLTVRDPAPFVPFPLPAYRAAFPKSKPVTPIFDARANGEIVIEGSGATRTWEVRDWPAMQGHNWGGGHADLYAWAHINSWNEAEGREVAFEGFSGRARIGRFTTPLVTILGLRHRGVRYEARLPGELVRARGRIERLRKWTFGTKQADATIEGEIELRDDDTVGLYYPNPTGEMTYCLNSKIAHAELRFTPRGRAAIHLTSNAAALEIGTRDATHGIRMYV